jgi:hypothetical protein
MIEIFYQDNQRSSARSQSVQGNFLRAHANTGPEKLRSQSVASSVDVVCLEFFFKSAKYVFAYSQ